MVESMQLKVINSKGIACHLSDTGSKSIVIFCHGYRSNATGPQRLFVRTSRQLTEHCISALRFDQFGSGNSEGSFEESSFQDWLKTIRLIAEDYMGQGYRVVLFGQSMGASAVIAVAADLAQVSAVVAWVPDANVEDFEPPASGFLEEGGERVGTRFWQEAYDAKIAKCLQNVSMPAYIVQCSSDEYVSDANHQAIVKNAQPYHIVEMREGYQHSAWTYSQATDVINKSVDFIVSALKPVS
jgi:uncharacterized protein